MKQFIGFIFFLFSFSLFIACSNDNKKTPITVSKSVPTEKAVPIINYTLVGSYPHDITSFTEGLVFYNNELYESTGATDDLPQTRSLFGTVDLKTGKINTKVELDREKYFGEGIVFLKGKVYQLTYRTKIGFVYDATTFKQLGQFTFPSAEGWGMTTDGTNLIMSDGTNVLSYLDPNSLQIVKSIAVSENGYAKDYLNELEYINGFIYANVWTTNSIVKIDVNSGKIVSKLNLTSLAEDAKRVHPGSLEMNGIAFDATTDKVLVTGKMWPKIYEIKFEH